MDTDNINVSIDEVSENEEINDTTATIEESKKTKNDVKSYHTLIFNIFDDFENLNNKLKELDEEYFEKRKSIFSEMRKLKRKSQLIRKKLPKTFTSEINKAKKEKRKRKGPNNGGVQKPNDVPLKLISYLSLEEGQQLSRPAVWKLLSQKFKDSGLRNGKDIILDKKTAKIFGKEKGHVIGFTKFSTFLTDIYKEDHNKKNENNNKNKNKKNNKKNKNKKISI